MMGFKISPRMNTDLLETDLFVFYKGVFVDLLNNI